MMDVTIHSESNPPETIHDVSVVDTKDGILAIRYVRRRVWKTRTYNRHAWDSVETIEKD